MATTENTQQHRRFNPRLLIPVVILTTLGVGGWLVEKGRAETRSTLSGFFESQPVNLASRLGGRVAEIHVQEGDSVRAGQSIVVFETEATRAEVEAQQAQARQAEAQLREVESGPRSEEIRRQEAAVSEASATLEKLRRGPLTEEIEAARARLRQAEAQLAKARRGARPQEIGQVRAAARAAKARLAQVERGPTMEEKNQLRARLEAAQAQEELARTEEGRMARLLEAGAVARQQWDRARTERETAQARVKEAGEALRRAEAGAPAEERAEARAAYQQAQAALALVLAGTRREDIETARAQADAARQALNLLLRGTRTEDITAAEARREQAQAALDALRAGSRREQIAAARALADARESAARAARRNLEERTVYAPTSGGIVERVLVAVGDLVPPGQSVARLADPGDLWLRVYVAEADLAKVRVGDDATLRVDGIAEPVRAQVESIATRGEFTPANLQTPEERGGQVFAVRLRLQEPDTRIKAGMFATVTRLGAWQQ